MSATLGRFVWPITIDATNNKLDFNRGGVKVATIASADYATPEALATQVDTKLTDADGATAWTVTVSVLGFVTIAADDDFNLLFNTGANKLVSVHHVLGFSEADYISAATYTGTYQHQNGFYFGENGPDLEFDSREQPEIESPQDASLSGIVTERPFGDFRYVREMRVNFSDEDHTYETTDLAMSWTDLWKHCRGGNSKYITYAADASDPSTSTNYHLVPEEDPEAAFRPDQVDPAVEMWGWRLRLRKRVT